MNYWYVAKSNELFLDIDNVSRSIKHAKSRLQGAIECGKLNVACVMQRPSKSKNHIHVIVTLNQELHQEERAVWEVILHGDIYRGCCTIMRSLLDYSAPDVLISPYNIFGEIPMQGNYRNHDDFCPCTSKHNAATMRDCPAAKRLRGEFRNVGFFGRPSKSECKIWPDL
jgi:hypothetical protein